MPSRPRAAVAAHKPSYTLEEGVFLGAMSTADSLLRGLEELLKPAGLTPSQYNVLRILRGAGAEGLACREISARMLTRDPDMTRLLDRLEARGLVARARGVNDRRVVLTQITAAGRKVLERLDAPVCELHKRQLQHMSDADLRRLAALLEQARETSSKTEHPIRP